MLGLTPIDCIVWILLTGIMSLLFFRLFKAQWW